MLLTDALLVAYSVKDATEKAEELADRILADTSPREGRDHRKDMKEGCVRCVMHWVSDVYELGVGKVGGILHMGGKRWNLTAKERGYNILAGDESE